MLPQDKESTSNKLKKKKKSLLGKKEINVRARGNIFHHFFFQLFQTILTKLHNSLSWLLHNTVLQGLTIPRLMGIARSKYVWHIGFLHRISEAVLRFSSRMEPIKVSLTLFWRLQRALEDCVLFFPSSTRKSIENAFNCFI